MPLYRLSQELPLDTKLLSCRYFAKLSPFENMEASSNPEVFVISKSLCSKTGELHNLNKYTAMTNTVLKALLKG